jgi:hypothetical protein
MRERYWDQREQRACRRVIQTVLYTTTDAVEADRLMDAEQTATDRPVNVLIAA